MKFKDAKFASLYYMQQMETGYPGRLLPFVLEQLEDEKTVIDIGAGNGFFAIPMADAGHSVTAVEPSDKMAAILKESLTPSNSENISLELSSWEDWEGPYHDASICIHALYTMADKKLAIEKMIKLSSKRIVIIRNNSRMRTITGIIRSALGVPDGADLNGQLESILQAFGLNYEITEIIDERDAVINDIEKEAESIMLRANIPLEKHDEVTSLIKTHCRKREGKYIFPSLYCDNAYVF